MEGCKKIAVFIPCLNIGGAENQAFRFCSFLKASGIDVTLIPLNDTKGPLLDKCKAHDIRIETLKIRKNVRLFVFSLYNVFMRKVFNISFEPEWKLSFVLGYIIRKNHFNGVVSYCTVCNVLLGDSRNFIKNEKSVFVWYQRDAGLEDDSLLYKRNVFNNFDYILANSDSGKDFLEKKFHVKCDVIRNGVESQKVLQSIFEAKKEFQVDAKTVVTMIGNVHHNKNHKFLIQAWNLVCSKLSRSDVVLLLAGYKGDTYEILNEMIHRFHIEDRVVFLGQVINIPLLLKATDIFVFSSDSEGSPNSVIEACLAELPVVAKYLPVIEEIICEENKKNLPDNISAMADCIIELIENEKLRLFLGLENCKKCEKMFNSNENFSRLLTLLLNKRK